MVKRMLAEGAPLDDVVARLKERGLEREDIELLLQDVPEFKAANRVKAVLPEEPKPAKPDEPLLDTAPGAPIRWVGIFLLLFVAMVTAWGGAAGLTAAFAGTALAALLALPLLVTEFANGRRRALKRLGPTLGIVFFIPAMIGLFAEGPTTFGVACAVLAASGLAMLVWASFGKEPLPGIDSVHPGAKFFEDEDVQFLPFSPKQETYAPGEAVEIVVLAQNCVDAPRELVVLFDGARTDLGEERRFTFTLPPGAIVEHVVPIRLASLAGRAVHFTFTVAGKGSGGRRLRFAEGIEWVTPNAQALKNALGVLSLGVAGFGTFTLGSNGTVRVKCDDSRPYVKTLPEARTRVLFEPTPEQLAQAARS
jgi:hypothetical protein